VTEHRIDWEPAAWLVSLVVVGVLATLAAVALGRYDLLVFGSPMVGALAGAWWTVRPERTIAVTSSLSAARVFLGEPVTLSIELTAPPHTELVDVELDPGERLEATRTALHRTTSGTVRAEWELRAYRWGRTAPRVELTTRAASGLLLGAAVCDLPELSVFPEAPRLGAVPRPLDLPDLMGVHLSRRKGQGVEFAGLREYLPGDPLRAVNWAVSARRGRLHVTERLAEQSAKVVTVIDAAGDIRQGGGPSTLDLSVQGALSVVAATLRRGDRAGVVALGGHVRWLAPDLGERHYYRVVEAVMDVQAGGSPPSDTASLPRTVLPGDAVVVVFSPLLDDRVISAVADLRRKGHGVVVVDVLRTEPAPRDTADYDPMAVRMWRIGRRGLRHRLSDLGIPVVAWPEDVTLDELLRPLSRRPLVGGRR
jgi:uncharacterized protein (DUF58 family)